MILAAMKMNATGRTWTHSAEPVIAPPPIYRGGFGPGHILAADLDGDGLGTAYPSSRRPSASDRASEG